MQTSRQYRWFDDAEEEIFPVSEEHPLWAKHEIHEPCDAPTFHMHFGIELVIVRAGALRTFNERHEATIKPGQVWFNGMWEPHGWSIAESPCEVVVTVCLPRILSTLQFEGLPAMNWLHPFLLPPEKRPQTPPGRAPTLLNIATRVEHAIHQAPPRSDLLLRLLLMESLLALYETRKIPPAGARIGASAAAPINQAVHLVFESRRLITGEEAARACGISRSVFNRQFKALMGIDFAKFALRHRLIGAAGQLTAGTVSVKEAAAQWGFTDASHLHRLFLRHFGCTPSEYRNRRAT